MVQQILNPGKGISVFNSCFVEDTVVGDHTPLITLFFRNNKGWGGARRTIALNVAGLSRGAG